MDYESCFERVWRAGLLQKAFNSNIRGRLWIYLKEFITDRKYYLKVNDHKSPLIISKVGIPQGSVLSPTLCNLYTRDSMDGVTGHHTEFADDASIWNSDKSIENAIEKTNEDLHKIIIWCDQWNMSIASEKTKAILFKTDIEPFKKLVYNNIPIELVQNKKLLGVTIDNNLSFNTHIHEKSMAGYRALKGLDCFTSKYRGCTQTTYMKLYKALVLPILDFGLPVLVTQTDQCIRAFEPVQRSAMLKASGCLPSTSTESLELLTNTLPMNIHIKLRQAEELVRIVAKRDEDPLKADFNKWMSNRSSFRGKPTTFALLMCRYTELKDKIKLENIEKEFEYNVKYIGLSRTREKVNFEQFTVDKETQTANIAHILDATSGGDILVFTDGSSLGNPGPTGAGAAIYLEGYKTNPVLLNKGVSKLGNNFSGEMAGIELSLDFLTATTPQRKNIHIFTDCQGAISTAFSREIPKNKIETVFNIKTSVTSLEDNGNTLHVHWIPGHKNIEGNELADEHAKKGAKKAAEFDEAEFDDEKKDAGEVMQMMKRKAINEKWSAQYRNSERSSAIHDIFVTPGVRNCVGEKKRKCFSQINQLLSGHTRLKDHWAKQTPDQTDNCCSVCQVPETIDHFLFHCKKYDEARRGLEERTMQILYRYCIPKVAITLGLLAGEIEEITNTCAKEELMDS
ncbi:uncharacterized protein LOC128219333 [Mya arenaria]|uniref:uncharacterized protein LOC128219333 n=1 Tax=Mya arenaria TaxID=6604 RepID=UPI0022DEA9EA|nr:uncharacterized protein LOC128219333 [Mya arenaria]